MMPIAYAGKAGPDLLLDLTVWDGRRDVTMGLRAPRSQHGIQQHPRHITAFDAETGARMCISPSVKGFADVAKRFKWGASN